MQSVSFLCVFYWTTIIGRCTVIFIYKCKFFRLLCQRVRRGKSDGNQDNSNGDFSLVQSAKIKAR